MRTTAWRRTSFAREKLAGVLFTINLALLFAMIIAALTFFSDVYELLLYLSFTIAVLTVICVILIADALNFKMLILFAAFVFFLLVSFALNGTGHVYLFCSISFTGALLLLPKIKVNFGVARILLILYSLFCVLLVAFGDTMEKSRKMLVINTNGTTFCLGLLCFALIAYALTQKRYRAVFFYFCAFLCFAAQFVFDGRIYIFGTVLLTGYLIFRKFFDRVKIPTLIALVGFLYFFSVIFAYLYAVVLYNLIGSGKWIIMGKDIFSGRQVLWSDAFDQIRDNFMFGIGDTLKTDWKIYGEPTTNVHNQSLGVYTCFGLFAFVVYVLFLSLATADAVKGYKNKLFAAFMIIIAVMGYTDTVLYSVYNVPSVIIVSFIVFNSVRKSEENKLLGGKNARFKNILW